MAKIKANNVLVLNLTAIAKCGNLVGVSQDDDKQEILIYHIYPDGETGNYKQEVVGKIDTSKFGAVQRSCIVADDIV